MTSYEQFVQKQYIRVKRTYTQERLGNPSMSPASRMSLFNLLSIYLFEILIKNLWAKCAKKEN